MHTLIHKLSIAWLLLAIVTAPFQALALPAAEAEVPDCEMHAAEPADTDAQAASHCPACVDHTCDGGTCGEQNCSAAPAQLYLAHSMTARLNKAGSDFTPLADRLLTSLSPAPLDRPPAV